MEQPIEPTSSPANKNVLVIALSVVVTALIVGGGVFLWQRSIVNQLTAEQKLSQQQIVALQQQLATLQSTIVNQNTVTIKPVQPFTYINNGQLFKVSKKEFMVTDQFNALTLKNQSQECGTNKTEQHFTALLSKYAGDKGMEYDFHYQEPTQDSGTWIVTIIPNKLGYNNIKDFKSDFDICAAGGDRYPSLVSVDHLLFVSSCGTGVDDGSGKPHGCDEIRQAVEPTIELK